jgi:hypothetical protein
MMLLGLAVLAAVQLGCSRGGLDRNVRNPHPLDAWTLPLSGRLGHGVAMFNGSVGIRLPLGAVHQTAHVLVMREGRLLEAKKVLGARIRLSGQALVPPPDARGDFDLRDGTFTLEWEQSGARVRTQWILDPTAGRIARRSEIVGNSAAVEIAPAPAISTIPLLWVSRLDRGTRAVRLEVRSLTVLNGARVRTQVVARASRETSTVVEDLIAFDGEPAGSFEALRAEAEEAWAERWKTDIEIDGPVEDQRAIRACLFQLYAGGNAKLPPFGTSNPKYNGHRFWDAEAWMLPVYALVQPEVARSATNWRARTASQRLPGWETGADGTDVTPPSHKNAIHIWGWVYWWLERAEAFGLVSKSDEAERAKRRIEEAFLSRSKKTGRGLEFLSVISPDEGRPRDNDLVTNLLARFVLSRRHPELATQVVLPRARDGLLASWDGDHLKGYQQTSALLALYPLEVPVPRPEAEAMFERYARLTSPNGPAMSDSIHATIAARFASTPGEASAEWSRRAYELWRESWGPFLDPVGGFSERRGTRETSFLTGAAGCLQAVIYGFAGLRLVPPGADIEGEPLIELNAGWRLAAQPALPPGWRSLTLRGIWLNGQRYTIRATQTGEVVITQG